MPDVDPLLPYIEPGWVGVEIGVSQGKSAQALLDHGAEVNARNQAGATALMWASPDIEKLRRLIDHGANVNARSETDRTALLVASSYPGTVGALQLLLDHGADLRAEDRGGSTALALAILFARWRRNGAKPQASRARGEA